MQKICTYKFLIFLFLLAWRGILAQIDIDHTPPAKYDPEENITIRARIENNLNTNAIADIYYRRAGDNNYFTKAMKRTGDHFEYEIPAKFTGKEGLEYCIILTSDGTQLISSPRDNPLSNPHYIIPIQKAPETNPPVLLAPEETTEISPGDPVLIAISLFDIEQKITDVQLFINDQERTDKANILQDIITLNIGSAQSGSNKIRLQFLGQTEELQTFEWDFTVSSPTRVGEKNLNYSGKITTGNHYEYINNVGQNISRLNFNSNGSWQNFGYRANIFVTSLENATSQPRNRYTFQLVNPIIDLALGDYYPNFSELSLYGKRIRGIQSELNLGFFNLHTIWGYSKRNIRGSIEDQPKIVDGQNIFRRTDYTFQQKIVGMRPSFRIKDVFEFGFSFLKVKDDTNSVNKFINGFDHSPDNLINMPQKPQENINLGADFKLAIDKNRAVWESEIGFSELNRNIYNGAISFNDLDTFFPNDSLANDTITIDGDNAIPLESIPFDPYDFRHIFTINENIDPLLPIVPDSSGHIGFKQIWNMPSLAILSKAKLNYFKNYLILSYKKVGPKYIALTNPYLQRDYREIKIKDRVRLFRDKLFLNMGLTNRKNNVTIGQEQQYDRNTYDVGLMVYPGGKLPRINISHSHNIRTNEGSLDSLANEQGTLEIIDTRIDMTSFRNNVSISQDFELFDLSHNLRLNLSTFNNKDNITKRPTNYNFSSYQNFIIRAHLTSEILQESRLEINISNNSAKHATSQTSIFGCGLNLNYLEHQSKYSLRGGYDFRRGSGRYEFLKNSLDLQINYTILDNQQVICSARYTRMEDRNAQKAYNNVRLYISWNLLF
ncbi:MAG: hypothetical protein K9M80_08325 [Candidatus Marinimicrobia bacterium]|nr:hypothetical protein [Candidatus Neomarinimicrobiota bacterium]